MATEPIPIPEYRPDNPALIPEYAAFHRLLPNLLRTHPNQYVAIYQGRVVAAARRPDLAEQQVYATLGDVPAYIGVVHPPPPPGVVYFGNVRADGAEG